MATQQQLSSDMIHHIEKQKKLTEQVTPRSQNLVRHLHEQMEELKKQEQQREQRKQQATTKEFETEAAILIANITENNEIMKKMRNEYEPSCRHSKMPQQNTHGALCITIEDTPPNSPIPQSDTITQPATTTWQQQQVHLNYHQHALSLSQCQQPHQQLPQQHVISTQPIPVLNSFLPVLNQQKQQQVPNQPFLATGTSDTNKKRSLNDMQNEKPRLTNPLYYSIQSQPQRIRKSYTLNYTVARGMNFTNVYFDVPFNTKDIKRKIKDSILTIHIEFNREPIISGLGIIHMIEEWNDSYTSIKFDSPVKSYCLSTMKDSRVSITVYDEIVCDNGWQSI